MKKIFFALIVCFLFSLSACHTEVTYSDIGSDEKVVDFKLEKLSYDFNVRSFINDYPAYEVPDAELKDKFADVCKGFDLSEKDIRKKFSADPVKGAQPEEDKIVLGLRQTDNSIVYDYSTENGFYFTSEGNLGNKNNNVCFIRFNSNKLSFIIGCNRAKAVIGENHYVRPVLIYKKDGVTYNAEFSFVYKFINK